MSDAALPSRGALAKAGVLDTDDASAALAQLSTDLVSDVAGSLSECADPDAALASFARLFASHPAEVRALSSEHRRALMLLLGASPVFAEHLQRHIDDLAFIGMALAEDFEWNPVTGESRLVDATVGLPRMDAISAMRRGYRQHLMVIALRDVVSGDDIEHTWARLSDAADAALDAALAIAQAAHPAAAAVSRLAVVAMGKCGARELNYVSDVDVLFVAADMTVEPMADMPSSSDDSGVDAVQAATVVAAELMRICTEPNAEGALWTLDANLRPEGRMGALVRSLSSYLDYYERWAKPWEFQALLKARAAAGDMELGHAFVNAVQPFVWRAAGESGFVAEARRLRQRVETTIGADADREIKLGPGGLRDVEFSVQLLQLVHGRHDESLRLAGTLEGLTALSEGGYVGRDDAAALAQTYKFLRTLEHRLQLRRLQRTHVFPDEERDIRWLGRSVGMMDDPVAQLMSTWRSVATDARQRHVKLFYRPLLDAMTRAEPGIARLSADAARERFEALGFADPDAAMRHVESLCGGVSRKAAIQRALMPVVLAWLAELPLPDAGLLAFRRVSEGLGDSPWYLRSLRDESQTAFRLVSILGTSRWLTELLLSAPESVAMLADDEGLRPRTREELRSEMAAVISRADDAAAAVAQVRSIRRRELWRIGCADLLGHADVTSVGTGLTALMSATLDASLSACMTEVAPAKGPALAVMAMGRFGGGELGYGSDADVMFVQQVDADQDEPQLNQSCIDIIARLRSLLSAPSPEPRVDLDADLRPEGRNGPLVRSVDSFAAYYAQWSQVWESQALLRSSFAAGSDNAGAALLAIVDPIRWPQSGLSATDVTEIRRLKARMESERLPRGVDPMSHLKLGPGGLSDVEWTVQLLQLKHASQVPSLQTTGTLAALTAAAEAGLLTSADANDLAQAWTLCTRVRNYQVLVSGRATDVLPADVADAAALAAALGYANAEDLRQEHARVRRLARKVMERVFYDVTG